MIRFAGRFYTEPGKRIRNKYKLSFSTKTNALEVYYVGIEDIQSQIDSFRDGCDLNRIVQKVAIGDLSGLNASPGFYGDVSGAPETLSDVLNARLEVNRMFDSLPDDVKQKFGSVSDFVSSAGTESWFKNLGVSVESPSDAESEVIE